jgi:phage tail-like protein
VGKTGDRNDPYAAFRFEVKIDDLSVGGFSECTGLQLEVEVQEFPEGGMNAHSWKFPGRAKQSNLTLKRGIVDRKLWDWFFALTEGQFQPKNGSVLVRDESGQPALHWHFRGAFPNKWTGPQLEASQNSVAVETLELAHQGLERVL